LVSLDISESALRITNVQLHKQKLANVRLAQGTMINLPFASDCFDTIISISVIHHAVKNDMLKIISEAYRILKKKGIFFANVASIKDPRRGEGEQIDENTFRILEAFEEKRFEELHHFSTKHEISEMFACFDRLKIKLLSEKPHYWWIMATK